jgi:type VI secretion system protein VasJ
VLGSVTSFNDWQWAAYGKHPVARDFVSMGDHLPLAKTLSGWIDKGFEVVRAQKDHKPRFCSWRFWVGGGNGDVLACGLLRDSRDGAGRAYPFLTLGSGSLSRWKENWDLLPFACEPAWNYMEHATVKMYDSLRGLESEILRVPPPSPKWSEYAKEKEGLWQAQATPEGHRFQDAFLAIEHQVQSIGNASEIYVPLRPWSCFDPIAVVSCWHSLQKALQQVTPNVVFMGGTPDSVSLAIYRRPLTVDDFVRLWTEDTSPAGFAESS